MLKTFLLILSFLTISSCETTSGLNSSFYNKEFEASPEFRSSIMREIEKRGFKFPEKCYGLKYNHQVLSAAKEMPERRSYRKGKGLVASVQAEGEKVIQGKRCGTDCTNATYNVFLKVVAPYIRMLNEHQKNNLLHHYSDNIGFKGVFYNDQRSHGDSTQIVPWGKVVKSSDLKGACPGDFVDLSRFSTKIGHSVIAIGVKGNRFCYWSSNQRGNKETFSGKRHRGSGFGIRCERLSDLKQFESEWNTTITRMTNPGAILKLPKTKDYRKNKEGDQLDIKRTPTVKAIPATH